MTKVIPEYPFPYIKYLVGRYEKSGEERLARLLNAIFSFSSRDKLHYDINMMKLIKKKNYKLYKEILDAV